MDDKLQASSIYGKPLMDLILTPEGVPTFLPVVINYLSSKTKSQGIFRKCGSTLIVKELGILFSCPQVAIPPSSTVDDVASFLKRWVRELPEPLLIPIIVNQHFRNNDSSSVVSVLSNLPNTNRKCLAYLFHLIKKILDNSKFNLMTFDNIVTCFFISMNQSINGCKFQINFKYFYNISYQLLNDEGTDFDFSREITYDPICLGETQSLNNLSTANSPSSLNTSYVESSLIADNTGFSRMSTVVRPRNGAKKKKCHSDIESLSSSKDEVDILSSGD
ncbi:GTPase activator activity protein [Tritrichomonas musculus]|uniref:GTPase activator activity protein n=1 Tax=Tritrichomonas musculus TaxID=1915356 RepID=A0ABR2HV92_9EUKA